MTLSTATTVSYLVRYGAVSEVARCWADESARLVRGDTVVVRTHRGAELGAVLERVPQYPGHSTGDSAGHFEVLRRATPDDERRHAELREQCRHEFGAWCRRIDEWNLQLQLIDLEWTLDRCKLILYVLNERGPDCTRLALLAAAAGFGVIEVQPVQADGLKPAEPPGGSCGCGSGGSCAV